MCNFQWKERLGLKDEKRTRALLQMERKKRWIKQLHDLKAKQYQFWIQQLVLFYDDRRELFPGKMTPIWLGPYVLKKVSKNNTIILYYVIRRVVTWLHPSTLTKSNPIMHDGTTK
ncbi:hypothetical protein O6H91_14G003900 [Diphasiastrum complanatum]|uniref:Uncharacterized protein n=1 Tax=Diphasiastrum complanatum TaxID=34168 RepID=A0ACC2BLR0_DIPCM|nr:hypothetical protein O6H91_14G003900 [Diphasiastrum complanatum]